MNQNTEVSRRDFLKISSLAGGGLLISVSLAGCQEAPVQTLEVTATPKPTTTLTNTPTPVLTFEPNLFVKISSDGNFTLTAHRSEMGQGVRTALPMIIAEELDVDFADVRIEQAPADSAYGGQVTGGSASVTDAYMRLRTAGATARQMLIAAAAQTWGVEPETCRTEKGEVIHDDSGQRLNYGELAEAAANITSPYLDVVTIKDPADFTVIGTSQKQVDGPQIVDGSAVFGMDVKVPGMFYAAIARCPIFGGKLSAFDASEAEAVEGVLQVVETSEGIAVVAESTWAAIKGRDVLQITWNEGPYADLNSDTIRQTLEDEMRDIYTPPDNEDGATWVEATYEVPYLAHATMEPMNSTADIREDRCEVWAPSQDPQDALATARRITQLPTQVHVPLIGCGLGRRLEEDYVREALYISQAFGSPIQVVWTREDDIRHDKYRPASLHKLQAKIDEQGLPSSWIHFIAGQGIGGVTDLMQGTRGAPYTFSRLTRTSDPYIPVPTGYWRAVYNTQNGFVNECFLDEVAEAAGKDPLELRLETVNERMGAVLELAAEKAGWGDPLPDGWGQGIACHNTWGMTDVAQVAEVSVDEEGNLRVHSVVCAIDCGIAINPDMVAAQMESGITVGLTAALNGKITIENGRVQQSNFHDYPLLRMDEMPKIEVYIVASDRNPEGVGEMGVPPIAPAVVNALFAATGRRIRRLPINAEDLIR